MGIRYELENRVGSVTNVGAEVVTVDFDVGQIGVPALGNYRGIVFIPRHLEVIPRLFAVGDVVRVRGPEMLGDPVLHSWMLNDVAEVTSVQELPDPHLQSVAVRFRTDQQRILRFFNAPSLVLASEGR